MGNICNDFCKNAVYKAAVAPRKIVVGEQNHCRPVQSTRNLLALEIFPSKTGPGCVTTRSQLPSSNRLCCVETAIKWQWEGVSLLSVSENTGIKDGRLKKNQYVYDLRLKRSVRDCRGLCEVLRTETQVEQQDLSWQEVLYCSDFLSVY